jgi:hypothetical protein
MYTVYVLVLGCRHSSNNFMQSTARPSTGPLISSQLRLHMQPHVRTLTIISAVTPIAYQAAHTATHFQESIRIYFA